MPRGATRIPAMTACRFLSAVSCAASSVPMPPYAHRGTRDRLNAQDGIFSAGGDQLMLNLAEEGSGFRTRFGIAMLDAIGQP